MKKILLFMLPVMALFLASCEKNNEEWSVTTYGEKLVKKISCEGGFGCEYEYDEKGRLIQCTIYYDDGGEDISLYSYGDNVIICTEHDSYSDDASITKYYLDDDGFLTKVEYEDGDTESYIYSDGKLTTICHPNGNCLYLWQGENISVYDYGSSLEEHVEYTDIEDKSNINIFYVTAGDAIQTTCLPFRFKGTTSKYLPQHIYCDNNDTSIIEVSYELDSDGYVTTIKFNGRGLVVVAHIEYYE